MTSIRIVGSGGHARVARDIASLMGYLYAGYYDDHGSDDPSYCGSTTDLDPGYPTHCAIGDNATRKRIVEANPQVTWVTLIHPRAVVASDSIIDPGCLIGPCAVIQPGVKIGRCTIINTGAIVEHDCQIGSFCHIAPSTTLCGTITIGDSVFIGAASVVIPRIVIGNLVVVGANSTVIKNLADGAKIVGVMRSIEKN